MQLMMRMYMQLCPFTILPPTIRIIVANSDSIPEYCISTINSKIHIMNNIYLCFNVVLHFLRTMEEFTTDVAAVDATLVGIWCESIKLSLPTRLHALALCSNLPLQMLNLLL